MRVRSTWPLIVSIAVAAAGIAAQQTRDAGGTSLQKAAPSGTAVLSGRLLTEDATPQPVRRATVRLAGTPGTSTRVTGTDDEGRFLFPALPAGTYTLSATKPGFVAAFHGSKRPGRGPGVPIAVGDGQQVPVTLSMLRGAVIAGTITDARGQPVSSVPVLAVEARAAGPGAVPVRATTDDRGAYRIFGLAPGDYVVSALPTLGVGRSAPAPEIVATTDAEVQWALAANATLPIGAGSRAAATMPASGRPVRYAPIYFPGTTDPGAATRVSLAAGQERTNVAFSIQIVTTARIAGTLVDHHGQPLTTGAVTLYPRRITRGSVVDALISSRALVLPRAVVSPPAFSIAGATPGEYTIVARTGSAGRGTVAAAAAAPPTLWNVTDVTVDGSDQTGLILRLQPGTAIAGSIVFEGSSLAAPDDLSGFEISMAVVHAFAGGPASSRAIVESAGKFRFASLAPGAYVLRATPPPAQAGARWTLKSAVLEGRDLTDVPLDALPGQSLTGLTITFTDRASQLAGTLVDAGGRPVTQYSIIVFTVDRSLWIPNARRIRSTTPATDGSFSVAGLPAGEYAMAAAEDVAASDLADPVFLSALLASAHRITLAEGERKTQNLRIGGVPPVAR